MTGTTKLIFLLIFGLGIQTIVAYISTDAISDTELEDLAEELFGLDGENNVAPLITIDLQCKTSSSSSQDVSPNPLVTVTQDAFNKATMQRLIALHDNFVPDVNQPESYSLPEQVEINEFIAAIFNTTVMHRTQEFLVSRNLPNDPDHFKEIWFGLYSRGSGSPGSSGFEHVFLGEINNRVSGFYNWIFFAVNENSSRVNYRGYIDFLNLNNKGSIIELAFSWDNHTKPSSSMFIGTSPELELSLYTICFYSRPNSKCPVSLAGIKMKIQTFAIGVTDQFVATAYPILPSVQKSSSGLFFNVNGPIVILLLLVILTMQNNNAVFIKH